MAYYGFWSWSIRLPITSKVNDGSCSLPMCFTARASELEQPDRASFLPPAESRKLTAMNWLEITVPGPGRVCMRRLDMRFHDLAEKLIFYDFDTAGEYQGSQLDDALQLVTSLADGTRNRHHAVLAATTGQSVIIGFDEAAELLPHLQRAIKKATSTSQPSDNPEHNPRIEHTSDRKSPREQRNPFKPDTDP